MAPSNNNEGRLNLRLPSGRNAVLRPYSPYVADAIGDMALQDEGTAYDKAICGLVEGLPNFEHDRKNAIKAARDMLINDYHYIVFMAVASFRDGVFEGDMPDPEGGTFPARIELLDEDGRSLPEFTPPDYPMGDARKHEWTEAVPDLGGVEIEFSFKLLDGNARAKIVKNGARNLNTDLISRQPTYRDPEKDIIQRYDPSAPDVPAWAAKILTRKIKEIDPVIQYMIRPRNPRGQVVQTTLFLVPDFFLQDFT